MNTGEHAGATLPRLDIRGRWFVDAHGRRVLLRGVNLGGDCKVPYPDGGTNHPSDFSDHRSVSFVGRPFPLDEADVHLGRLARWGFNVVRLLTTWEAVEHAGPGRYDEAYLDYFEAVCEKCAEHGLYVFVDFHQDVWSRMTGGDGAPGWTLEAVGLDFTRFHAAGAAHVMQAKYDYTRGGRQDAYPRMSWSLNYRLPANRIMWTLFFGGRDFTPGFEIGGVNVQDYLQGHYLGAMRRVAARVASQAHVLGFDTLNEPGQGMIGEPLDAPAAPPRPGVVASPLDTLLMARGVPRKLPRYARDGDGGVVESERVTGNPDGISIWRRGAACPFEAAGAYRWDGSRAEQRNAAHFTHVHGRAVDLEDDYMAPFFARVAETIRDVRADWLVFAEMNPYKAFMGRGFPAGTPPRTVNASHWYDIVVLRSKRFDYDGAVDAARALPGPGADAVRERYVNELSVIAGLAETLSRDGAPTLIGELGIPFDLDDGAAYAAWARGEHTAPVWAKHVVAQSLMYDALDALLLNATQWNYTASNRNDAACGDGWNQEDLSVYSRDQQHDADDPDAGGRAVAGFSRPFARFVAGEPARMRFDLASGVFTLVFDADPAIDVPTEIFVPRVQYPYGCDVDAPDCRVTRATHDCVHVFADTPGTHTITLTRSPAS